MVKSDGCVIGADTRKNMPIIMFHVGKREKGDAKKGERNTNLSADTVIRYSKPIILISDIAVINTGSYTTIPMNMKGQDG